MEVSILVANTDSELSVPMKTALVLLLQAYDRATKLGHEKWDFALEIQALKEVGVNHNDLRTLICQGIAEHLIEQTRTGSEHRTYRLPRGLRIGRRSCFALATEALAIVRKVAHQTEMNGCHRVSENRFVDAAPMPTPKGPIGLTSVNDAEPAKPTFDPVMRTLSLGSSLVKAFRVPAQNQIIILSAFQEDNWPPILDDPLPPQPEQEPKKRLRDTIRCLNRNQKRCLIKFFGDGQGLGVGWKICKARRN